MKEWRARLAIFAIAGGMTSAACADVLIDDFSSVDDPTPWPVVITTIDSIDINELGLTNVIGGSRHSTVRATFLETLGLDFVQAAIVPNFGMILDYSSTAGARGDWDLLYDEDGAGLNADFSAITDIMIEFGRFDFANGQPLPVTVTLFDGNSAALLTRSLDSPGPQTLSFAMSDFSGIGLLDLAHLQSISVFLDPGAAVDFRLTQIYGVPAPASLALLGLGAAAIGGRRWRGAGRN